METSTDFYPHNGTSLVSTARTEDVNFNYGSGELNYTTDTEEDMSASRILDHPTLDPNLLPTVYGKRQMVNYMIIQGNQTTYDSFDDDSETPPDIETPHADNVNRAICQTSVEDSDEEIDLERTRRICEEEQDDEDGFNLCSESSRESSFGGTNTIRSTEDVRGNIQSCTTSNGDVSKSVDGKNDNGSTTPKMTTSRPSIEQLKNASARLLKATLQNNPPVESKSAEARRLKAEKAAAEAKAKGKSTSNVATTTRVQKKDRVSVLESAKASDVPKIIRPPKPKSKHQILMDQIKASLEAEKNRPKKVVTSTIKVQLSENKTGSCKGSTEDMNKPVNVASKNTAPISKRVPLRTTTDVNGKSVPPNNVKKLPISKKIEATASARATKVEKPVNAVIPTRTTMSSRINRPTSSFAPAIAHSRKGSQASGVLSTTSTLSRKLDLNKAKQGDHAKTVISADKEMMLKQNADAALVMAIALNNINCQLAAANARHAREISIKKQWQDNWETKISNLNDELIKDGRLGEFEKQNEQLQKEKRDLQATLAKSNDEKIKTLYAEISSLNHAFDMRTEEAKNLRRQNEKLILENDTIAGKDIKIRKLTVKLADLSSQFELQKSTQKALAKKVEEAHQEANLNKSFNDSLSKENDFLKYRCEELTQSVYASELEHSDSSSGTMSQSVKLRSSFTTPRKDEQSPRPVSCSTTKRFNGYPMEASQSSRTSSDVMQTSLISIYQDSYRKRNSGLKNRNADIIYGPDGAFVGGEESFGDEEF
uniref:C2H2-type domain-containing protein n=1 Tax=Rhabditophanes sp. KR3021 TaxID=114890 RepID=A0AC35TRP9_9BILA